MIECGNCRSNFVARTNNVKKVHVFSASDSHTASTVDSSKLDHHLPVGDNEHPWEKQRKSQSVGICQKNESVFQGHSVRKKINAERFK